MRRAALVLTAALFAAACGTGSTDVEFDEPVSTLFPEEESGTETVDSTTTTAPAIGVDDVDPESIPDPRSGTPGVVRFDTFAAPVIGAAAAGWTVESPCGAVVSIEAPAPVTAVVVLDPIGDATTVAGGAELRRNATLVELVRDRLDAAQVPTVTSRDGSADLLASYRRRAAEASGARVIVSVSLPDGDGDLGGDPALEVVHPAADTEARRLAGLLHAAVEPVVTRFAVSWPADVEPGVRAVLNQRGRDFFAVLQEPSGAARAVVHLPVDPAVASTVWETEQNLAPVADAIADAIVRHLVTEDEGSGFVAPPEVVRDAAAADPAAACVDPLAVNADG